MAFFQHLKKWLRDALRWFLSVLADKPDNKDQVWQMVGAFFRELAVLLLAFYPLEQSYFRTRLGFEQVLLGSLVCLIIGIVIERRRGI